MITKQPKYYLYIILFIATISFTTNVRAAIISDGGITTEGWGTFFDPDTNRTWLDLSAVHGDPIGTMITTVEAAGWIYATSSDVAALLGNNPRYTGPPFQLDIMGGVLDFAGDQTVWGVMDISGSTFHGYAFSWNYQDFWTQLAVGYYSDVQSGNEMGIWAYREGNVAAVPEPSLGLLLGITLIGLVGVGAVRKIKQNKPANS